MSEGLILRKNITAHSSFQQKLESTHTGCAAGQSSTWASWASHGVTQNQQLRKINRQFLILLTAVLLLSCFLIATPALARRHSLKGYWITNDGVSNSPVSIIEIIHTRGGFAGRIKKVNYHSSGRSPKRCSACKGHRHNKPTKNMTIMWGFKRQSQGWYVGRILDINTGRIYNCKMRPADRGEVLQVRVFVGISLFGRTLYWRRYHKKWW